jgi:DNA-binding NtrC family response regulator
VFCSVYPETNVRQSGNGQIRETGERRNPLTPVTVLALLTFPADRNALKSIVSHSNWDLRLAESLSQAEAALYDRTVNVVISDRLLSTGECWTDLLSTLETLVTPPPLIVTDTCADAQIWGEVFNLGGYDFIFKPFNSAEVVRTISGAWLSWKHRLEAASNRKKPVVSADHGQSRAELLTRMVR